ncbi:putative ribonuclease ZC3H12D [Orchesella cincta]|uniref:Putative ribonuclease ZC3H12D n=1 Tax=Orchesella cincta TaxID=48709 RepID=A0A1D2NGP3_ORCCI|nr:putative ribonuclease ZC3H12D [Orchesella cincta]
MFFTNTHTQSQKEPDVGNFWMEPSSHHECFRTSPLLLETARSKHQRIQGWVTIATTELKKWQEDNLDKEGHAISGNRKETSQSQQPENWGLSVTSSESSLYGPFPLKKDNFAFADGFQQNRNKEIVDDKSTELICQIAIAKTRIHVNQAKDMANQGATGSSNKRWKNEATSKVKSPIEYDHCKKLDVWNPKMSSKILGVSSDWTDFTLKRRNDSFSLGATAASSTSKTDINPWKRKLSKEEANLPVEEKRLRRLQRFAVDSKCHNNDNQLDLKQPNAVNYTLEEIIVKNNITYTRQPSINYSKEVESDPPEENKDDMFLPTQTEPVAPVVHQNIQDKAPVGLDDKKSRKPRPIVIDGYNVAMEYGEGFCDFKGIQVCMNYFFAAGHEHIVVVVPERYLEPSVKDVANQYILYRLQRVGRLMTCWSPEVAAGKYISSCDDRMIIQVACERDGVIVSNDKYRDLYKEDPKWRENILNRLLPFRFVQPVGEPVQFMLPQDPHGPYGPTLKEFLHFG